MFQTNFNDFETRNFMRRYISSACYMPRRHALTPTRRQFATYSQIDTRNKEGVQLEAFFDPKKKHANEVYNAFEAVDKSDAKFNRSNNDSNYHSKFRAEIIYYPLIHGDLRRTVANIKNRIPTVCDIEMERIRIKDDVNRRIFTPTDCRPKTSAACMTRDIN